MVILVHSGHINLLSYSGSCCIMIKGSTPNKLGKKSFG